MLQIKNAQDEVIFTQNNFTYQGEFMGERSVSCTATSPTVLPFSANSYIDYRGERFKLYKTPLPTVKKKSSSESIQDAFTYELKFLSQAFELQLCQFRDVITGSTNDYYENTSNVEFTGDASYLRDRIQACLDEMYFGAEKWTINLAPNLVTEQVDISGSDISCWDALSLFNSTEKWKLNFVINGKTITVGSVGEILPITFEYGKGNGLYSIDRIAVDSESIITRLRVYGSDRNIPENYKREGVGRVAPDFQYQKQLMLPAYASISGATVNAVNKGVWDSGLSYVIGDLVKYSDGKRYYCTAVTTAGVLPTNTSYFTLWPNDYIESETGIALYGIREGVFRDETVFPSLKGITGELLVASGIPSTATGRVDEIIACSIVPNDTQSYFYVFIKDIGFNINEHLVAGESAILSLIDSPTGLGGTEFQITSVVAPSAAELLLFPNAKYRLTLNVNQDDKFNIPNPKSGIYPSDNGAGYLIPSYGGMAHFVLLNINMPLAYVLSAEQRLLTSGKSYLAKNDHPKVSYAVGVDEIQMARLGGSIHSVVREGCLMGTYDQDLGVGTSKEDPQYIIIQSLTIKEGFSRIPTYDVTLSDTPVASTLGAIKNDVKAVQAVTVKNAKLNEAITDRLSKTINGIDWITQAMASGETSALGGLLLTNLLFMRDIDGNITGGLSGLRGDGILDWGGGSYDGALRSLLEPLGVAYVDREDGSGHKAFGNLKWDSDGNLTIAGKVIATSGQIGGLSISGQTLFSPTMEFGETDVETLSALKNPEIISIQKQDSWRFYEFITEAGEWREAYTQQIELNNSAIINFKYTIEVSTSGPITNYVVYVKNDETLDEYVIKSGQFQYVDISNKTSASIYLPAGKYSIRVKSTQDYRVLENRINIYGYSVDDTITVTTYSAKTKIGRNGYYSFWDNDNYIYYSNTYGYETRVGNYGQQITESGIKTWDGSAWVFSSNGSSSSVKNITSNYQIVDSDLNIHCYNTTGVIYAYLPPNPYVGQTFYIRRQGDGGSAIDGNGNTIWVNETHTGIGLNRGTLARVIWDGTYWICNLTNEAS